LEPASNELIKAEDFLSAIERADRYRVRLGSGKLHFFGYCQGCRNRVLHGHFKRGHKTVQYFRHCSSLYDLDQLQRMEMCGWYDPKQGKAAKPAKVPMLLQKTVKAELKKNAYGIWRFINAVVLDGVGKIGCDYFLGVVKEILEKPRITSGCGFSSPFLPFYVLSQINEGGGTVLRDKALGKHASVWLNDGFVPSNGWDYIHFSLLPEFRQQGQFAIRFIQDSSRGRPNPVLTKLISLEAPDYAARIARYEEEALQWLGLTDDALKHRYPRNPNAILSYRNHAARIEQTLGKIKID
jgi:hypothetical protein